MEGKTIHHYKILEEIGRGGMGVVYKAEDTKLKRTVALKFLPPNLLAGDEEKARFIHEAQAAASLHHPNICTIYEINEADGQTFISMAYLKGQGLNELIGRGPMAPLEVVKIARQVARGLQAAHEQGIVHRDIKSSNVMIEPDGRATVMDFGLAKSTRQTYKTELHTKMGTISYMSPEQTRGENVDQRTDIWSLGVLMYEMVTGRRPFRGDYDEAVIYSILNEEPVPISDLASEVPPELESIILKAMAKKQTDRYQTAAELADDLELLHEEMSFISSTSRHTSRLSTIRQGQPTATAVLFSPRVLAVLAIYLVAAAVLFKLIDWSAGRFMFSPQLAQLVIVALLSLIPAVWILAVLRHSRLPIWSKVTRIGVPANLIVSVVLLYAIFNGHDIDAATETVTVQDETGKTMERLVPKKEFRKSLALYFLDNKTGNSEYDWISSALALMLELELYQDPFLHLRSSIDNAVRQRMEEAGFSDWTQAPWNLKRKIAEDAHLEYLLTGSFNKDKDEWLLTLQLHESKSARLVVTQDFRDRDLFKLVDQASLFTREALGIPKQQIETNPDLPVSEMITASVPALEAFCKGVLDVLAQDWSGSIDDLKQAVELDSTFTYAYFVLFQVYRATNQLDQSGWMIQRCMQHLYKMPERIQFLIKANYYASLGQADKVFAIGQMMVELHPDDMDARQILAEIYQQRNELTQAIEQYENILQIDPSRSEFLQTIAGLYKNIGDYDRASHYYEQYLDKHPEDVDAYHAYGQFFAGRGEFDRARELYEKALIIEPNRVAVLVDVGDIDGRLGRDESALAKYKQALATAKTSQDRIRVYESVRDFYTNRGRMKEAVEQVRLLWAEQERNMAPVLASISKLEDLTVLVKAGRGEEAFDMLQTIENSLYPPLNELVHLGFLKIYNEVEDPTDAATALANLRKAIDTYKWERMRDNAWFGEGEIEEAKGRDQKAIHCYEEALKLNPNFYQAYCNMGRCFGRLGEKDRAVKAIETVLKIFPNDPDSHYELALVYHRAGNRSKALEHLNRALDWWKGADPEFKPAQKARATLAEWKSSVG